MRRVSGPNVRKERLVNVPDESGAASLWWRSIESAATRSRARFSRSNGGPSILVAVIARTVTMPSKDCHYAKPASHCGLTVVKASVLIKEGVSFHVDCSETQVRGPGKVLINKHTLRRTASQGEH